METSAAYQYCEDIVRSRARNFAYGIRLLPKPKRQAMCAVYAFARRIDDIADGTEPNDTRVALLNEARADLHDLDRRTEDPALRVPASVAGTGHLAACQLA